MIYVCFIGFPLSHHCKQVSVLCAEVEHLQLVTSSVLTNITSKTSVSLSPTASIQYNRSTDQTIEDDINR
jgi:hypothetical protein